MTLGESDSPNGNHTDLALYFFALQKLPQKLL